MMGGLDETRRLDSSPWEPIGRFRDGFGQFLETEVRGGVAKAGWHRVDGRARPAAGSGLTRRGVVYEYARSHPGSHIRAMARELGIATGDLQYHLSWLERHGYVKTRKSGFFRFVFPTMVFKEEQEALLAVLSQKTPREILLCLLGDESPSQGELASSLGYSQPTVSWHMGRLERLGMVARSKASGRGAYEVLADRGDIVRFVKSYHPEVWRKWAGRLGAGLAEDGGSPLGARLAPRAVVELVGKR